MNLSKKLEPDDFFNNRVSLVGSSCWPRDADLGRDPVDFVDVAGDGEVCPRSWCGVELAEKMLIIGARSPAGFS